MGKRMFGVAVLAAVLAMGSVALAFSISSSQDLSAGGSIVGDGAGNTVVRDTTAPDDGVWQWGDRDGDDTNTAVATAGLDVGSNKLHTGNASAVDILLDLNGGNITGRGVWNATPYHSNFSAAYRMPARYEAISTQHSANYEPPPTGDIIIKNVGDISCGAITTHTIWWYGSKSAAAGAIRIGEASGSGDGPAGNIRVDALDAQCDKQNYSGGIIVYSTGFVKIQDGDNDGTASLGVASTRVLSYESADMYFYHEGAFRAGRLLAHTSTGTYGTTQNGGTIFLDGNYDTDTVTTPLGACEITEVDNAYKRNGYGDPNEHVTIQNYASVTLGDVITYNALAAYTDNHGGNITIQGIAGDITITGAIDAHATNASANAGVLTLQTTGSTISLAELDCDLVKQAIFDNAGGDNYAYALLNFDTADPLNSNLVAPDQLVWYDRALSGMSGTYFIADGGIVLPIGARDPRLVPEPAGLGLLGLALLGRRKKRS